MELSYYSGYFYTRPRRGIQHKGLHRDSRNPYLILQLKIKEKRDLSMVKLVEKGW
ncbi:hypothetical protein ASZ90_019842 [hydrocarbon metagenome]|uniref:Uncharacterized protein n=1 Tax=hydrocarbon metagenome TaxID=938273 RepID=A0A0W8E2C3_9ZZZZ